MRKEVIYTGTNLEIINLLKNQGVRTTRISNIAQFKTSERSIYLHFDNELTLEETADSIIHHRAWASSKNIPSICVTKVSGLNRIKSLYSFGFTHVFKEDQNMCGLLKFLNNNLEEIPPHLLSKDNNFNRELRKIFSSLSNSTAPLLINGESGVGKTYIIKEIATSVFPNKVFISKNLSEYSPHILESELFGHAKGAFTGATTDRKGLFELANGGTLFLDEIATLPLSTQQKILKVIEEKCVTPVGANKSIQLDFRLITATCENLEQAVEDSRFREDLYFRLAITSCRIPSISERTDELEEILFKLQSDSDHQISFSDESMDILKKNIWKGNYRELQSLLHELRLLNISYVTMENLPIRFKAASYTKTDEMLTPQQRRLIKSYGLPELIKQIEVESFRETFETLDGRTNKICDDLKISKSVYYRISQTAESSLPAS